jgi:hypothetical protein
MFIAQATDIVIIVIKYDQEKIQWLIQTLFFVTVSPGE